MEDKLEELEEIISILTTNFEKAIPQEERDRVEIVSAFKNYLYLAVKTIHESTSKFIRKDIESVKSVLTRIADEFSAKDINSIRKSLFIDEAFEEIRKKSIEIFEIAKKKVTGRNVDIKFDISTVIEEMQDLLKNVKEFNQRQARELISEAVVDLKYLTESDENNLSLRLYHFIESIKSIEEER